MERDRSIDRIWKCIKVFFTCMSPAKEITQLDLIDFHSFFVERGLGWPRTPIECEL